tara:strand:- start:99 stop:755 length:657 start_codon:yes stop_codon:yes gene_type:complete
MKTLLVLTTAFALSGSALLANCDRISENNALYKSITQSAASKSDIKRLQQIVGVRADGIWGRRSNRAFEDLVSKCNSYSYPSDTYPISDGIVTDYYQDKTVFEDIPYKSCSNQKEPIYGKIQGGTDPGAVVGGAIVGGIIGKVVSDTDGGTALGAIIGGALANENQKAKTKTAIVGYEDKTICTTKYKRNPRNTIIYSYSTVTFDMDGREYVVEFQRN